MVLFLSLESTITPLLFTLGLLFPIAYNFGTNIFLGQISYITEALATVQMCIRDRAGGQFWQGVKKRGLPAQAPLDA